MMEMTESIICSLDDSTEGHDVARVAAGLAARLGLELVLLHVAPAPTQPGVGAAAAGQERLAEEERNEADALLAELAQQLGLGDDVERRVEFGDPAVRVLEICEQENPQLLVLGSRGRGGIKSAMLGSVSNQISSKATCPVVIVPPGAASRSSLTSPARGS
jgi:nucleotide-binding universal stress UspA family protein